MKTNRRLILGVMVATLALAAVEPVYVSRNGKTFHKTATCMALARTKTKLTADRKAAEAHGLKPCGICWREKATKKAGNGSWATSTEVK